MGKSRLTKIQEILKKYSKGEIISKEQIINDIKYNIGLDEKQTIMPALKDMISLKLITLEENGARIN